MSVSLAPWCLGMTSAWPYDLARCQPLYYNRVVSRLAYERVDVEESECLVGFEDLHGRDLSCGTLSTLLCQLSIMYSTLNDLAEDTVGGHLDRGHSCLHLDVLSALTYWTVKRPLSHAR